MKTASLSIIIASTLVLGLSHVRAISIESVESAAAKPALQKVDAFLNEQSVARQLTQLGVSSAQVEARLATLDDAQLTQLAAEVAKLQAAGDITSGTPHPLGPFGCVLKKIGDTISHVFKLLFCWTDI